jgi:hypothetical protein
MNRIRLHAFLQSLDLQTLPQLEIEEKACRRQVERAKSRRAVKMVEKKKESFNWLRRENRGMF